MLFDKNGIYLIGDDYKNDYDFAVDILNGNMPTIDTPIENKNFYNLEEALKRGNLFPSLYDQYKNYQPSALMVNTAREKALLDIQMLDFTINDLNLYLDLYPNDKKAYSMFKKLVEECLEKKREYSSIYGPLTMDNVADEYEWSTGVWPWEEGGM